MPLQPGQKLPGTDIVVGQNTVDPYGKQDKSPLDPMTGKPYSGGTSAIKSDGTVTTNPGPTDYSRNYYGKSVDGRQMERIGNFAPLDQGAFNIGGIGQLRSSLGDVYGGTLGIAQNANTSGAGVNAAQSRAMALGALTAPGPSAAQGQLFAGQEAAARNALAMAKSGRGFGSAGALQQAQFAGQEGMQLANQQAATLRAQEEANRRQQMLALGGLDQQALGQAFGTQLAAGNQGLQALQQSGQLSVLQQQALADRAKFDASMAFDASKTNAAMANNQYADNTARDWAQGLGAGGAALGGIAALLPLLMSDERAKTDIAEDSGSILEALGAAPGYSYRYKNPIQPGAARGRQHGPMAQDLERLLPGTVVTGQDGFKRVDTGRLSLATASGVGELARRQKALEQRLEALGAA